MKLLTHLTPKEVVAYFDYDNMQANHPDFCPLYSNKTKCHIIEKLNCYLCACIYFRFDDQGIFKNSNQKTLFSYCAINAKQSRIFETEEAIHNDCTHCNIPHKVQVIEKNFDIEWKKIMNNIIPQQKQTTKNQV